VVRTANPAIGVFVGQTRRVPAFKAGKPGFHWSIGLASGLLPDCWFPRSPFPWRLGSHALAVFTAHAGIHNKNRLLPLLKQAPAFGSAVHKFKAEQQQGL
jgi:hypothetical protein